MRNKPVAAPHPVPTPKHKSDCCTRVLSGNSIEVKKADGGLVKVRLLGVGTPEMAVDDPGVRDLGKDATRFVKSFILDADVRLEPDPSVAKVSDGLMFAYVYRLSDAKMLNHSIISDGWGFALADPTHAMLTKFLDAEKGARFARVGIWRRIAEIAAEANERRAGTWLKIADNLRKTNAKAAKLWYDDIITRFPDTISASAARERLEADSKKK
jgi:endonuclease YncB( thermonuclease family)